MKILAFWMLLMFGISASTFACDGSNYNQTKSGANKPVTPAPSTAK
jgi:hypothetical protein